LVIALGCRDSTIITPHSNVNESDNFAALLLPRGVPPSLGDVEALVREEYGIDGRAERLTGERDENFRIRLREGGSCVFKVANIAEPPTITHLQLAALLHLEQAAPELPCPRVIRSLQGRTQLRFTDGRGEARTAALYTFLPGQLLFSANRSMTQRRACGRLLAGVARALRKFEHPASRRTVAWDLQQLPRLASLLASVDAVPEPAFLAEFVAQFSQEIVPRLGETRHQFVHNDFSARNIVVDPVDNSRVTRIFDFGDSVHTALVADIAVGVMGQLTIAQTAEEAIRGFIQAYCEVEPLHDNELGLLNWLIAGRIVQNVVITAWHRAQNPITRHFDGFDKSYFEWRVALAKRLIAVPFPAEILRQPAS